MCVCGGVGVGSVCVCGGEMKPSLRIKAGI